MNLALKQFSMKRFPIFTINRKLTLLLTSFFLFRKVKRWAKKHPEKWCWKFLKCQNSPQLYNHLDSSFRLKCIAFLFGSVWPRKKGKTIPMKTRLNIAFLFSWLQKNLFGLLREMLRAFWSFNVRKYLCKFSVSPSPFWWPHSNFL